MANITYKKKYCHKANKCFAIYDICHYKNVLWCKNRGMHQAEALVEMPRNMAKNDLKLHKNINMWRLAGSWRHCQMLPLSQKTFTISQIFSFILLFNSIKILELRMQQLKKKSTSFKNGILMSSSILMRWAFMLQVTMNSTPHSPNLLCLLLKNSHFRLLPCTFKSCNNSFKLHYFHLYMYL